MFLFILPLNMHLNWKPPVVTCLYVFATSLSCDLTVLGRVWWAVSWLGNEWEEAVL